MNILDTQTYIKYHYKLPNVYFLKQNILIALYVYNRSCNNNTLICSTYIIQEINIYSVSE